MSGHFLLQADARAIPLADESVDCVVTSPPYWGLRDYGVDGQIGLEKELDCLGWATGEVCPPDGWVLASRRSRGCIYVERERCFVCEMVAVFREVWRVLKPWGTCWLNLGDKFITNKNGSTGNSALKGSQSSQQAYRRAHGLRSIGVPSGLKHKDLSGLPWRVAFALQAAGWWLRSDIIWHKPSCMPESTRDRPTMSHEYVFLLSKASRYFYDQDAIREPFKSTEAHRASVTWVQGWASEGDHDPEAHATPKSHQGSKFVSPRKLKVHPDTGHGPRLDNPLGRNKRSVWSITTQPRKEAHFATFPEKLAEICILAGTSARGVCPDCGRPWVRKLVKEFVPQDDVSERRGRRCAEGQKLMDASNHWGGYPRGTTSIATTGWEPGCDCDREPKVAVVLDPFAGSGTTCRVAEKLGRIGIGLDLSWEYLDGIARGYCAQPVQGDLLKEAV